MICIDLLRVKKYTLAILLEGKNIYIFFIILKSALSPPLGSYGIKNHLAFLIQKLYLIDNKVYTIEKCINFIIY
ncbi:hypothetical protein GCM10008906_21430 [Clostridium oceanicum]|uniref:Uncharacterized protein n=1 Tax=Clostridium oceanicum TaxID=1543 RepID=A0ABN1JJ43_9CLOT